MVHRFRWSNVKRTESTSEDESGCRSVIDDAERPAIHSMRSSKVTPSLGRSVEDCNLLVPRDDVAGNRWRGLPKFRGDYSSYPVINGQFIHLL